MKKPAPATAQILTWNQLQTIDLSIKVEKRSFFQLTRRRRYRYGLKHSAYARQGYGQRRAGHRQRNSGGRHPFRWDGSRRWQPSGKKRVGFGTRFEEVRGGATHIGPLSRGIYIQRWEISDVRAGASLLRTFVAQIQSDSVPRHSAGRPSPLVRLCGRIRSRLGKRFRSTPTACQSSWDLISFAPHPMTIAIRHLAFAAVSARGMPTLVSCNGFKWSSLHSNAIG